MQQNQKTQLLANRAETEHFSRLNDYFIRSKLGYNLLLGGAKHFGFHPNGIKVSERRAITLMQDIVAEKLKLKTGMNVLDAGCGQGVVATYLAKKYSCKINGITIVPFEIDCANKISKKRKISHLTNFSLMDYSKMSFPDNHFDAIFTLETLSHALYLEKTLREIFRVLKPNGKIAFFEYTVASDTQFTKHEMRIVRQIAHISAMTSLYKFKHTKFSKRLKETGFVNIKTENITKNVTPTLKRFYKLARVPYIFVKITKSQEKFPNITAAVEFYRMSKKGLFQYNIFTAEKTK